ncbi:response regulator [Cryobacterium sp. TMS1-13-1]|uniref:response regulator n=1 Tax=Cryobacterium sp. TMS1-13-1 TaxID=1259220 RepID=UPI00106CA48D|nr:response regulator [Cryobacterium sp. TMS1-13-1]TFD21429.1 response regulator [Cryobacterium sp. TMS1-13-1]
MTLIRTAPVRTALIRTVVIDDDREVAGIHTGFLLAHGGFEIVGVAYTGTDGLDLITRLKPDLVLLDIHLPGISGIEVLRAARNLPGDPVDIIAITAARELDTVRAAMAGGVMHYLVKPFTSTVLLERLDQYVQHRLDLHEHAAVTASMLDQARIDRMLQPGTVAPPASAPGPAGLALSKGLSEVTLDAVVATLKRVTVGISASDVAQNLGLARVSARRYLEFLVAAERAGITQKYGHAGRPEKLYHWTAG